jgi:hypothetical protein
MQIDNSILYKKVQDKKELENRNDHVEQVLENYDEKNLFNAIHKFLLHTPNRYVNRLDRR